MEGVEIQPHLKLKMGQVHPTCIVVGDPVRAKHLADKCEHSEELAWHREYRSINVTYKGFPLTVVSHGVGSSGAAIAFEELMELGAKCIIRAGTAGSMDPAQVKQGDIVVVHSAVREDGVTALHVPPGYPAVGDHTVWAALWVGMRQAAEHCRGQSGRQAPP
eukprot:Selendium_serpulae@DN2531_c0_g1_i3.p1